MRIIDADDLMLKIGKLWTTNWMFRNEVINEIHKAPTIEPIKHGEWRCEEEPDGYWHWYCSECEHHIFDDPSKNKYNYCPNCGARMEEVTE